MEAPQSPDLRPRPQSEMRPFRGDEVKTSPWGRVSEEEEAPRRACARMGERATRGHSERTATCFRGQRPPGRPALPGLRLAPERRGNAFLVLKARPRSSSQPGQRTCLRLRPTRLCPPLVRLGSRSPPLVTLGQGPPAPPDASRRVEVPSP